MRILLTITFLLAMVVAANAVQDKKQSDAQEAIDKIMAELKDTLAELSVLDESDKKLALSNKIQLETTEMLNRTENKIKHEDIPALQQRAREADEMRQQAIDSGCPPEGGKAPIDLANRCNPIVRAHRAKVDKILEDKEVIEGNLATIKETREAVSKTTLANAKQQKENNARRDQLKANKLGLYSQLITNSMSIAKAKAAAVNACKSLSGEQAHCCLSVVWDGANPERCEVELIYQVFEKAGIFSTTIIKPKVTAK